MNATGFVTPISNIGLVNVCHYIVSFGIIFNSKGLIKSEIQNQTVPVFNALFQYLHESSNSTDAKIQLLRDTSNKTDGDRTFDMKYLNETYMDIVNEGLFSYYGNITKYLLIRDFAENTNFTALKEIVFDDLSKNYINNVSCSLGNVSSNIKTNLSQVAIDNLFADYMWPVFKQTTGKSLENGEKRELQIDRRWKRQVSDNDSDDSSNLDIYFAHLSDKDKKELLKGANENLSSEANQLLSTDNEPNIQSQATVGADEPKESTVPDGRNFDFLNFPEGTIDDEAMEEFYPSVAESNLNYWPDLDIDSSSRPKIRRIDASPENPSTSSRNEISYNEDGFINRARSFQSMMNAQNNRVLGRPGYEIDIDDIPGTSTQSEASRIGRFLRSRENRERLGFFDNEETEAILNSIDDEDLLANFNNYDNDELSALLDIYDNEELIHVWNKYNSEGL